MFELFELLSRYFSDFNISSLGTFFSTIEPAKHSNSAIPHKILKRGQISGFFLFLAVLDHCVVGACSPEEKQRLAAWSDASLPNQPLQQLHKEAAYNHHPLSDWPTNLVERPLFFYSWRTKDLLSPISSSFSNPVLPLLFRQKNYF